MQLLNLKKKSWKICHYNKVGADGIYYMFIFHWKSYFHGYTIILLLGLPASDSFQICHFSNYRSQNIEINLSLSMHVFCQHQTWRSPQQNIIICIIYYMISKLKLCHNSSTVPLLWKALCTLVGCGVDVAEKPGGRRTWTRDRWVGRRLGCLKGIVAKYSRTPVEEMEQQPSVFITAWGSEAMCNRNVRCHGIAS